MKSIQIAHPSAAIELIAAARQITPHWESWGKEVTSVSQQLFGPSLIALNVVERHEDGFRPLHIWTSSRNAELLALLDSDVDPLPPEETEAMYDWRRVESMNELLLRVREYPNAVARIHRSLKVASLADGMALTCRAGSTQVALSVFTDRPLTLTRDDRRLLTQVSLHIEQALRLRLGQANELAILRPDGKVLHAEGPLEERGARQEMTETVRAIERARSHPTVSSAEIWTGLVRGKLGLSPRQDGSDRHYVVLEHQDPESRLLELSPREMRIVELAAEGLSNKLIAYALGISEPTVSRALGAAALKLGCNGARDLVAALSLLLRSGPKGDTWTERPTPAEQEVLELLRQGLSNAEIAAARGCSTRTVANQVASLLRKAGADSRRAL